MAEDRNNEGRLIFQHPLCDHTRRERRWLLLVSLLAVVVTQAQIVPAKIDAFGLEFTAPDQRWLIVVCGLLVLYFFLGFCFHALMDWLEREMAMYRKFREDVREARETLRQTRADFEAIESLGEVAPLTLWRERLEKHMKNTLMAFGPARIARNIFEFFIPVAFGLFAMGCVVCAVL